MKKWVWSLGVVLAVVGIWWLVARHRAAARPHVLRLMPPEQTLSMRSLFSSTPASITFSNRTDGPLQVEWLDFQGRRQVYGTVSPHSTLYQVTYARHAWVCVDERNDVVALFQALPGHWVAIVGGLPDTLPR